MTQQEKLDNSLLKLMWTWAFWGRLIARAKVSLCSEDECPTASTDGKGRIRVCGEFMDTITFHETVVLLCHEIMHIVLHQTRGIPEHVNMRIWNIAEDIWINDTLAAHFFHPDNGSRALKLDRNSKFFTDSLWTNDDHSIEVKFATDDGKSIKNTLCVIEDVPSKTVNKIYDEIINKLPPSAEGGDSSEGGKDGNSSGTSLDGQHTVDDHSEMDKQNPGKKLSDEEKAQADENRKKWESAVLTEVAQEVKNRGTVPAGFENLIKDIKEPKISWKEMLRNAFTSTIINDSSYRKFNKRSIVLGTPMPGFTKEGLSVMVHLDTSGSTYNLLSAFLGEICGIMRQHPGSKVTVVQCDAEIQSVQELDSEKGLTENPIKGFGGTSHQPVIDYVNKLEESKVPKILVSFTDGYSDIPQAYKNLRCGITSIFVMPKDGMHSAADGVGQLIVMDDETC